MAKPILKLWGRPTSGRTQKVLWTLEEIGLKFDFIMASATMGPGGHVSKGNQPFGVVNTPEYRAKNPNGRVPTIDDGGFVLWESNSIVRYLAGKHQNRTLEPADLKVRARAQMWMDWQLSVMAPAITPVFWNLIRTPPEKRDPKAIEAGKEKTVTAAKMMDAQLGKTKFMAGNEFSYGDIPLGIMIYRYMQLIPERAATPNLDRWYAAISGRAAFKEQITVVPLS